MARRLRSGDVLEVEFPKVPSPEVAWPEGGYGYLTYVGKHRVDGDVIRVRPGILHERPPITEDLFKDSYIVFYPANHALKYKLVTVVGQVAPVPMPTVFRRGGWRLGDRISAYLLDVDDGTNVTTFFKYTLTEEEKKINIAVFVNHESLLMKMSEGWKPEWESEDATPPDDGSPLEGIVRLPTTNTNDPAPVSPPPDEVPETLDGAQKDALALNELAQGSNATQPRALRHYLYFKTKKAAREVATDLRKQGFEAKEQRSADGKDWLVLASHTVVITGELVAATRQSMEELVLPFNGQYDGWEAEVS